MKKIISNISEFSQGFKMGVQLQAEAINVPMWLSWMLSVLLIPLNLVIVAVLLMMGGTNKLREYVLNIIESVKGS